MPTIPQWFVTQWDRTIRHEVAQKDSRLSVAASSRGTIEGEAFTINKLGDDGSLLEENTVRHGDTNWSVADHTARVVNMADFYEALPLDRNDIPKMLVNPVTGGNYMQNLTAKRNRRLDDIIYRALRGTQLLKDGSSIVLPTNQKIAAGGAGFTKAKLIQARKIFRRNEADNHNGEVLNITYNDEMLEDILSDTTLTSADFLAVKMLQEGDVSRRWMGFNWIPYNNLELTGGVYYAVAWCNSGVHWGEGYMEGNVTRRGDKKDAWQVSLGASYGAGREDEKKVVEIAFQ